MQELDLESEYNNRQRVPDHVEINARWLGQSEDTRAAVKCDLDLGYGPGERQRYDLFHAASGLEGSPLVMFIHGGYWQRNAKETFACMAAGPLANGMDVAFIGYTLCPEATLSEIVDEIAAAVRWLRRDGPHRGAGEGRLVVSGWSAGGHLTATTLAMDEVDAGLAISGIYDVEPCRLNYLNDRLNLTAEEAAKTSPLLHLPKKSAPVVLAYGTGELPELQRQSVAYHDARRAAGLPSELLPLAGLNHFSIMDELEKHDGVLARAARALA